MLNPPFHAWMTSILEEKYRAVAHLPHAMRATGYRLTEPGKAAFNAVYGTSLDFYTYSNELDHPFALNFAISMEELARNQLPFLESSYPLERLEVDTHFVDVAGGFGNLSLFLAKKFPQATFSVQDHPFIIEHGQRACPPALKNRVKFFAHDMLSPQPKGTRPNKSKLIFLLKIILHDHGDEECKVILGNLLAAMEPGDRILIIDTAIPEVGGSLSSSMSDIIILAMFGCGHRTLSEFKALIHGCAEDLKIDVFTGGKEEFDGMVILDVQKK
ncbi:hypothetical protein LCI18_004429 [Fusarium solani-melongenae]|uniref:Uncharacterized protein n=1 Tax=Fusarium solani subsp. cucurbitae TaxID=2747967 RepID=A0ACD3YX00_FUSSC|nr:hypothetical protein LCI18_004429 [Fusarium solani-melongenae]